LINSKKVLEPISEDKDEVLKSQTKFNFQEIRDRMAANSRRGRSNDQEGG